MDEPSKGRSGFRQRPELLSTFAPPRSHRQFDRCGRPFAFPPAERGCPPRWSGSLPRRSRSRHPGRKCSRQRAGRPGSQATTAPCGSQADFLQSGEIIVLAPSYRQGNTSLLRRPSLITRLNEHADLPPGAREKPPRHRAAFLRVSPLLQRGGRLRRRRFTGDLGLS